MQNTGSQPFTCSITIKATIIILPDKILSTIIIRKSHIQTEINGTKILCWLTSCLRFQFSKCIASQFRNQKTINLFESPVLIKTLYFPSFSIDTLNYEPVKRDYYMISVYYEDTNADGLINNKDLRRFYYFDLNGLNKNLLVPDNYSVISSQYDSANDCMYVFAQLDENKNGQRDPKEEVNIFRIDLKNPKNNYKQC